MMKPQETAPHEIGEVIWFGFHVQYRCKHCDATLNFLHESGAYQGASKLTCKEARA